MKLSWPLSNFLWRWAQQFMMCRPFTPDKQDSIPVGCALPASVATSVSFTLEVEFEFTTWAWVQATAETAFGSGLVVRSPGSVKALNQSTHNSLGHCRNVHLAVAGHGRMNFRQWPATAKWTFRQWPRELWVDWFNALIEPGDRTTRPLPNAVSAVAWTQAQVVNSNSTLAVQDPRPPLDVSTGGVPSTGCTGIFP